MIAISHRLRLQISLMVLFGGPELLGTYEVGSDEVTLKRLNLPRIHFTLQFIYHLLGDISLKFRVEEDGGGVLGALVIFLSILLRRIMKCKEVLHEVLVLHPCFIVDDVGDFDVASIALTYPPISRIPMLIRNRIHVANG